MLWWVQLIIVVASYLISAAMTPKPERPRPGAFEAACQQQAEGLMREPPLERIGDEIEAAAARKGLDQHLVGPRQRRALGLNAEPFRDRSLQCVVAQFDPEQLRVVERSDID